MLLHADNDLMNDIDETNIVLNKNLERAKVLNYDTINLVKIVFETGTKGWKWSLLFSKTKK